MTATPSRHPAPPPQVPVMAQQGGVGPQPIAASAPAPLARAAPSGGTGMAPEVAPAAPAPGHPAVPMEASMRVQARVRMGEGQGRQGTAAWAGR